MTLRIDLLGHEHLAPSAIRESAEEGIDNFAAIGLEQFVTGDVAQSIGNDVKLEVIVVIGGPAAHKIKMQVAPSGHLHIRRKCGRLGFDIGQPRTVPTVSEIKENHIPGIFVPLLVGQQKGDSRAKTEYRRQLQDLRQGLVEAEQFGDRECIARVQEEMIGWFATSNRAVPNSQLKISPLPPF